MHLTWSPYLRQAVVDNRHLWIPSRDGRGEGLRRVDHAELDITRVIVRGDAAHESLSGRYEFGR